MAHLTTEQRYTISCLSRQRMNQSEIADSIGKHKSVVCREIHRNKDQACMDYLASIKWPEGFICEKCGHTKYCKGKLKQTRQCTSCGYQATPTSGTLFHKVKFPLLKPFTSSIS